MRSISEVMRDITAFHGVKTGDLEGDVVHKFKPDPEVKPPRRRLEFKNISQRSDYMKEYMKKYREEGKDYQKIPKSVKDFRRKQRERLKKKLRLEEHDA